MQRSETARPMEAKLIVEYQCVGVTKVNSGYLGNMTKMTPTPLYSNLETVGPDPDI